MIHLVELLVLCSSLIPLSPKVNKFYVALRSFSLPYIQAYGNQIKGFVPVAPVGVSSFDPPRKVKSKVYV